MTTFIQNPARGVKFSDPQWFTVETCIDCGIHFGVPSDWKNQRLKDRNTFYCPNGHNMHYTGESEADRLRRELAEKQKQLEAKEQQVIAEENRTNAARQQRDEARKSHRKMRDRVKNGVCPCCNRTFQNLLNHMRTQHPEYGKNKTLKQLRETFGMTQAALSKEIGCYGQHVCNFENGRSVPVWARDQIEAWIDEQGQSK